VNPTVVIGIDGGTEAVLRASDGRCPNIAALRREGAACALRSTIPPITAAAWASMVTGWNPGRHGMYDFRTLDIERYTRLWASGHSAAFSEGQQFVNSRRWAGAAVWDLIGERGRVAILSVPMTYPAWEVNGRLVAGFPLPDYTRNHTYPSELADSIPPLLAGADTLRRLSDEELASYCLHLIEEQRRIVLQWVASGEFDLVVAVFQSTDFAQHRLWKYLGLNGHPLRDALLDMYGAIDKVVGEVRALLGEGGTVALVSDHGFGPHPHTFVRTDAVLRDAGLLTVSPGRSAAGLGSGAGLLRRAPRVRRALRLALNKLPERVGTWFAEQYTGAGQFDWSRTLAFRLPLYAPAEGVVVNLAGRQSRGVVQPGAEYESVRDDVIAALVELREPNTGMPVVQWARRREEVFRGPYTEEAPDVVALLVPQFKGTAGLDPTFEAVPQSILEHYSGVHAMEGIFAVAGPGVRPDASLGTRAIEDVAPTLLALLDVPIPADVDGIPMEEALFSTPITAPEQAAGPSQERTSPEPSLTAEEAQTLEQSLRALGYLE
jgi:predicted AlkP superfamily phosphohydrolase/phosphomutase